MLRFDSATGDWVHNDDYGGFFGNDSPPGGEPSARSPAFPDIKHPADDSARVHSARAFEATRHAMSSGDKEAHGRAADLHRKASAAYGDHFLAREHASMAEAHAGKC